MFLYRCIKTHPIVWEKRETETIDEPGEEKVPKEVINTTEQSSWAPTSHVLVVNCEATKATISATIKAIPVHRYPLSPFEL